MPHKFLPHSRYVFLDLETMLGLGGLDDTHPGLPAFFTNYVYNLSLVDFNKDDQMYLCQPRSAMKTGRGCFSLALNDGFVYVFGGVTGAQEQLTESPDGEHESRSQSHGSTSFYNTTKLSPTCEKYDVENDQWYLISDLPVPLKNAGACALTSDSIYLFGGHTILSSTESDAQHRGYALSCVIFQYVIAANIWLELQVALPQAAAFMTPVKLNNYQIVIFGGQLLQGNKDSPKDGENQDQT